MIDHASRSDLRHRLAELARGQSGYFTAAQAREVGYSYASQRYHVQRGNWFAVDRAMFRLRDWPTGPDDDLVRWSLWSGGKGCVSHDTALAYHGLGDANPSRVHLTVPRGFRKKAPGVELHRADLPEADVVHAAGFAVTTPIRSLLDAAASEMDADHLETAVDDALRAGLVTPRMLRAAAEGASDRAALRVERALAAVQS